MDAVAARTAVAAWLEPPDGEAVLRSVAELAASLFDAEAASIAVPDATGDRLVIRVAGGVAGAPAVGLSFASSEGIAGYVFTTGQTLAVSDVEADPRFDRATAERTGYVPRSILAVPILGDAGCVGVLEVLDRRADGGSGLRDLDVASQLARQAAVILEAGRVERDTSELLARVLLRLASGGDPDPEGIDAIAAEIAISLDGDDGTRLWALADAVARVRTVAPDQVALVIDILDALARRAGRPAVRSFRR
jgi:GAF domain-containing protein